MRTLSVRGSSERSENAAGGLFQHPASFDSRHNGATLLGRDMIGHNHTPRQRKAGNDSARKNTPSLLKNHHAFPAEIYGE